MQNSYRNQLLGVGILLIVVAAAFLTLRSQGLLTVSQNSTASTTGQVSTTTSTSGANGEIKITQLQELVAQARTQKNAGNYTGAIATLLQAQRMFPGDVVVNNNLGDIYMNFQKDYVKAEAAYKTVIATDPRYLDAYRHLFELYTTTSYKPTNTAAADIIAAGLKANPNAYDLQVLLARWYKSINSPAEARVQYQAAINNAKGQGLTSIASQIEAELKTLPQ